MRHWKWNFRGTWNRDDFYDLFGPTKKSRRGYSLGLEWNDILVYDDPRFWRIESGAEFWGDLETLPGYQEIAAPTKKLTTAWTRLEFDFLRKSLGGVDMEKGTRFTLEATADVVSSDVIPRLDSTFDLGFPLPINHSSIWLRTAAGHAFGDVDDPFANFFFGGFGNNYVDRKTEKRYREIDSFPGLEINEVGRPQLRQGDGRVEPTAAAFPHRRQTVALHELAAARAVRRRAPDQPRPARRPHAHGGDGRSPVRPQGGSVLEHAFAFSRSATPLPSRTAARAPTSS